MQFSHIFLGLIATVSAIDIYGHRDSEKCDGGGVVVCTNANPNDCCVRASGDAYRAIQWRAIPPAWNVIGQAFSGGDCNHVKLTVGSNGRENICAGGSTYSGGNYIFGSRKRGEDANVANEVRSAEGGCVVKRGDLLQFEDGHNYNLTDLDDGLYNELVISSILHPHSYLVKGLDILTFCVS